MAANTKPRTPAENPYRVVVADDPAVLRRGVRALLQTLPGIEVAGKAANGLEALNLVRRLKPGLVALDLATPEMNGLEFGHAIRNESAATDMLVLTMHFSHEVAGEALRCGTMAYALKSDADTDLQLSIT